MKVKITDYDPALIALATENVKLNQVEEKVSVESLKWGENFGEIFDIVIGSEITYDSATWRLLIETILTSTKPGSFLLLSAAPRFMEVLFIFILSIFI